MRTRTWIPLVALVLATGCGPCGYNRIVQEEQGVESAWSQVENQYQRRLDLIPNLVETVKGYATHESSVFEEVAEARSSVGKFQVSADILNDPQLFQKFH